MILRTTEMFLFVLLQMHEWGTAQTPVEIESSNFKAQIHTHKQLPAAIRSAFILGVMF